ncbi:glyoxalase, partial [Streptomyces pharetrae CZA14]
EAARAELLKRGLEVSEPVRYAEDDGATFMYFNDPDGNGWSIQEYRRRATEPLYRVLAELARKQQQ